MLTSIYSDYNNLQGKEYLLKLRSTLKSNKDNFKKGIINFEVIHNLYSKINKLLQTSFDEFPSFNHNEPVTLEIDIEDNSFHSIMDNARCQWITFFRNGSWFITSFDKFQYFKYDDAKQINTNRIKIENKTFEVINKFGSFTDKEKKNPDFYLVIYYRKNISCYAVTKLGKRIYSQKDLLTPKLIPFKESTLTRGRVRVFGKNHIYL